MASNPLIAQGTLNRLRASVNIPGFPALNVTAPYLGKAGISLALEGDITTRIPTMTGIVNSGEPYQMVSVTINLLRTQNLSALYKQQIETNSVIGDFNVIPDASTLPSYYINNGSILSIRELPMAGEDAGYVVVLTGYYNINSSLWNLA
jgi:hypothetical protein